MSHDGDALCDDGFVKVSAGGGGVDREFPHGRVDQLEIGHCVSTGKQTSCCDSVSAWSIELEQGDRGKSESRERPFEPKGRPRGP